MKRPAYLPIVRYRPSELSAAIEGFLNEGFELQGGVSVAHVAEDANHHDRLIFVQAVVRSSPKEPRHDDLWWAPGDKMPPPGKPVLCKGESYDSGYHGGYLIAYTIDGEWVSGKQQEPVKVVFWRHF